MGWLVTRCFDYYRGDERIFYSGCSFLRWLDIVTDITFFSHGGKKLRVYFNIQNLHI